MVKSREAGASLGTGRVVVILGEPGSPQLGLTPVEALEGDPVIPVAQMRKQKPVHPHGWGRGGMCHSPSGSCDLCDGTAWAGRSRAHPAKVGLRPEAVV